MYSWLLEDLIYRHEYEPKDQREILESVDRMLIEPIPGLTRESRLEELESESFSDVFSVMGRSRA